MSPSSMELVSYEGSPIKVIGDIHIPVQCGKHKLGAFHFYVTSSGANIMGVDLFDALGFQIVQGDLTQRKEPILQVVSKWQSEWPSLFTGLGCVKEFAQPMINPDVRPVVQSLRRIPLALRGEVSLELKRLESVVDDITQVVVQFVQKGWPLRMTDESLQPYYNVRSDLS